MTVELTLDDDGNLWLREDDGDDSTLVGPVDDPATSYLVPDELLDELGRLEVAWAEAVGFRDAIRDEAITTYRRNSL